MSTILNYETFVNDNKEYLKEFHDKRVIVTYGGGKDASTILHFLIPAKKEFGFEFETHAIMFPTHVYKTDEVQRLDSYWKARGIHINWHPISESESPFETAKKNGTNPCEFCHSVKRKYSFQYLDRTQYRLEFPGHNYRLVTLGYCRLFPWNICSAASTQTRRPCSRVNQ